MGLVLNKQFRTRRSMKGTPKTIIIKQQHIIPIPSSIFCPKRLRFVDIIAITVMVMLPATKRNSAN